MVTKIKNQGNCGACWALTVIETIESMWALKTQKLRELSVQQIIDCDIYNDGCDGGNICNLLLWLQDYKIKIQYSSDYPTVFKGDSGDCKMNTTAPGVEIKEFSCDRYVFFN